MGAASEPADSGDARPLLGKRCLIVEDRAEVARAEAKILGLAGAFCFVARTLAEARLAVSRAQWAVALVDLALPDGSGGDLVREIASREESTGLLVYSGFLDDDESIEFYQLGALPFHKEDLDAKDLVVVVRAAMARASRLRLQRRPTRASGMVAKCSVTAPFARRFRFTKRQSETFDLLYAGIAPKEIAHRLGITEWTVKRHIQDMLRKCHVANKCELVALAGRTLAGESLIAEIASARLERAERSR